MKYNNMKLTIDTDNKTVEVSDPVNIQEFMKTLKKLLPNGEWKEYNVKFKADGGITYIPVYMDRYVTTPDPVYISPSPIYVYTPDINLDCGSLDISSGTTTKTDVPYTYTAYTTGLNGITQN